MDKNEQVTQLKDIKEPIMINFISRKSIDDKSEICIELKAHFGKDATLKEVNKTKCIENNKAVIEYAYKAYVYSSRITAQQFVKKLKDDESVRVAGFKHV